MKNITLTLSFVFLAVFANAQVEKLAGPRIGVTFLSTGISADIVNEGIDHWDDNDEIGNSGSAFVTQYGWQWESRFADGHDVTGLVEWVVLVGGMEKGLFLPSVSSMVGARTSSGLEFALGPNLSLSGIGMVFGAGFNFKAGDLNLPVNIAFTPSFKKTRDRDSSIYNPVTDEWEYTEWEEEFNTGSRFSIMIGFNLGR